MSLNKSGVHIPTFIEPSSLSSKRNRPLGSNRRLMPPAPPRSSNHSANRRSSNQTRLIHSGHEPGDPLDLSFQQQSGTVRNTPFIQQFFEIQERLGFGSFGDVYKVRNTVSGKLFAIKRSRRVYAGEVDRSRQLREVQRVVNIPYNEHLVHLTRAWEETGHLYLQMELCRISLGQHMEAPERGKTEEQETWNIFIDILLALEHLHTNRLVHLDVKPDNIFLTMDSDPVYKLGDFGIVVCLDEKRDISEFQEGDSRYLAPEVMNAIVTTKADVFSLGLTLIEICCHVDLPKGGSLWHQLRDGSRLPDPCNESIPADLFPIIRSMLQPNVTDRPEIAQILELPIVQTKLRQRQWQLYRIKTKRIAGEICNYFKAFLNIFTFWWILGWNKNVEKKKIGDGNVEVKSTPEKVKDSSFSDDEDPIGRNHKLPPVLMSPSPFTSTPISARSRGKRLAVLKNSPSTSRNLLKEFEAVSDGD